MYPAGQLSLSSTVLYYRTYKVVFNLQNQTGVKVNFSPVFALSRDYLRAKSPEQIRIARKFVRYSVHDCCQHNKSYA